MYICQKLILYLNFIIKFQIVLTIFIFLRSYIRHWSRDSKSAGKERSEAGNSCKGREKGYRGEGEDIKGDPAG